MTFNTIPYLRPVDNTKPADEYLGTPPPTGGDGSGPTMDGMLELNNRVTHIEAAMATKDDIASIKDSLSAVSVAISSMDAKMDISSIRASVEKSHTDIYKWVATLTIGAVTIWLSIYSGIRQLQPSTPVSTPPSISAPATVTVPTQPIQPAKP
jgi:hypothetical protein